MGAQRNWRNSIGVGEGGPNFIKPSHGLFDFPVWPVRKPDGSWCVTMVYIELNRVTLSLYAAVRSIAALTDPLIHEVGSYHYVVHLANAFFSVDIAQESQEQFAFMWEG